VNSEWQEVDGALHKKFEFRNFAEAFAFMTKVAAVAEQQNHHPDWSNSWNIVEISLWSHDKGAITQRDHDLANAIDELLA
jgi:4a-hydroxytetrahydrobiopterin dehydratase